MSLRVRVRYFQLLESFLRWFESRGESPSSARFAAAATIAIVQLMNIATVMLFTDGLGGARWLRVFDHVLFNLLVAFALVWLHWWLIGRIQRGEVAIGKLPNSTKVGAVPLWVAYFVASATLLFVAIFATT